MYVPRGPPAPIPGDRHRGRATVLPATCLRRYPWPLNPEAAEQPEASDNRGTWAETAGDSSDESVAAVYSAAGGDFTADGRHPAGRLRRLSPIACVGLTGSGLPDDPGPHVLSRRQPRGNGVL